MNQWWGYKHVNGSFQVKRYFDPRDIEEALESPFVDAVTGPWPARDREHALEIAREKLAWVD